MNSIEEGIDSFKAKEYINAFKRLMPFAQAGNSEAQCIIANIYELGLGLDKNIPAAIEWYLKSANQGYGVASNNLAGIFMSGYESVAPDPEAAVNWYEKAIEQGFSHTPLT